MSHASSNDRNAQLEAELVAKDQRIAALQADGAAKDARIAVLERQVAELSARLGQNSRNSHRPPSSDTPDERRKRRNKDKKAKQQRKRGAQAGHQGAHRELLPPEKVNKFVDLFPNECENCWRPLPHVPDPAPKRHQQTEVPPIGIRFTEPCSSTAATVARWCAW